MKRYRNRIRREKRKLKKRKRMMSRVIKNPNYKLLSELTRWNYDLA